MIKLKLILCSWLIPCCVWAQQPAEACASTMDQKAYEHYRQQVQQQSTTKSRNGRSVTLKLQPHIIRRSNGTGGLSQADLNASIQQLNRDFAQVGFYFDYCYPNYVDDDGFYNEVALGRNSELQLGMLHTTADAVNVFFLPSTTLYQNGTAYNYPFGWGTFPYELNGSGRNWVMINNALANQDNTLSHELGHYFNLLHTHHSSNRVGGPTGRPIAEENVTRNPSDPCFNCDVAGDLLCDTEADPVLDRAGALWVQCIYQGAFTDNCQQPYQPDTRNIMSYAYSCRLQFSQGQIDRMWAALDLYRGNITDRCSGCFPFLTVTQTVFGGQNDVQAAATVLTATNLVASGGTATYTAGNAVFLRPGFEVQAGGGFSGRIVPCASQAAARPAPPAEAPASAVHSAASVQLTLAPNPATEQVAVGFALPAARQWAQLRLFNAQGQEVQRTAPQKALDRGTYQVSIRTQELPAGLYVVQLLTEQEAVTKQLVVLKP